MQEQVAIIGSGFSGLSAACFLAHAGRQVTVIEKHDQPGGRARTLAECGFRFDMGPSWYWMPDVFERFFRCFGKDVNDYYQLKRLDPSYRVYWPDGPMDIPADYVALKQLFESLEAGSGKKLDQYLKEAKFKYEVGMNNLVYKSCRSVSEFTSFNLLKGIVKLDVFTSARAHIRKHFKNPKIQQLLEFPFLFLGALPKDTPALYSLMDYADIKLGTWYPEGGMTSVVNAMYDLARSLGVRFHFGHAVKKIVVNDGFAQAVETDKGVFEADVVLGSADYHHVESTLLDPVHRSYSATYWEGRKMAPSCLIYFVGLSKKLKGLSHHTLFFDVPFLSHADEIYTNPAWPKNPLFYVSCTSKTDATASPEGQENLFILIPVAPGIEDTESIRAHYFQVVINRMEQKLKVGIMQSVVYHKSYAHSDFVSDYNSFKGNAYGLANTLRQTAIFKPSIKSRKVKNLFYTGQLTVPGPGVPPSIISGEVAAKEIIKFRSQSIRTSHE